MARRLLSIWFPRLASDVSLRSRPVEGPFALTLRASNAEHLHCLNLAAGQAGLQRGMSLANARAICPVLSTRSARAGRLKACVDGLIVDASGVAHPFGGEEEPLSDVGARLERAGIAARGGAPGHWRAAAAG